MPSLDRRSTLIFGGLLLLGVGCVPGATPGELPTRPGWPVARPQGAQGPFQYVRVTRCIPPQAEGPSKSGLQIDHGEQLELERWLSADGHRPELERLRVGRDGSVIESQRLYPDSVPPAWAEVARSGVTQAGAGKRSPRQSPSPVTEGGVLHFPIPLAEGLLSLNRDKSAGLLQLLWSPTGTEAGGIKLATLPDTKGLVFTALRPCGSSPELAGLLWRQATAKSVVEGVELLDLRRARAITRMRTGLALHRVGHYERAEPIFRQATALDPALVEAHYNLACACAQQGKIAPALAALARAIRLDGARIKALAEDDPDLAALHDDPRFSRLLSK